MRVVGRQHALREVGDAGELRLAAATAAVPLGGLAGRVAARYLAGAGVGTVHVIDAQAVASTRGAGTDAVVEIAELGPSLPLRDLGLRDVRARELAAGALLALRQVRLALGMPT
jgi:hypothetical protein